MQSSADTSRPISPGGINALLPLFPSPSLHFAAPANRSAVVARRAAAYRVGGDGGAICDGGGVMDKDTGGRAFPTTPEHTERFSGSGGPGMTLRDWFAGQALNGLLANKTNMEIAAGAEKDLGGVISSWAYEFADAMLKERAK